MRAVVLLVALSFLVGCSDPPSAAPPGDSATAIEESPGDRPYTMRENRRWAEAELPGLDEAAARARVRSRGLSFRVVRRDGRDLFHTDDLIRTRVNVAVRNDKVTRVVGLF